MHYMGAVLSKETVNLPRYGFLVYSRGSCFPPSNPYSLASQANRLDVVARILVAASDGWRITPSAVFIFLEPLQDETCLVVFDTASKRFRFEREASTAIIQVLRSKTARRDRLYRDISWREAVRLATSTIGAKKQLLLSERGDRLTSAPREPVLYIIGSNVDPPETPTAKKVSIGPKSYLASQVAAYINYLYNYSSVA